MPSSIEIIATLLFAVAVIHTFSVPAFARLAHRGGPHAGFRHLFSEVEAVFGVWAFVLIVAMGGPGGAVACHRVHGHAQLHRTDVRVRHHGSGRQPSYPGTGGAAGSVGGARAAALRRELATFFVVMSLVPLGGSFITEPAAMTLAAILLRDAYFRTSGRASFKYLTLGVLFVNVSIGGVLTSYAAPPVLMVASTFGWDSAFMLQHFGWRAAVAVCLNAGLLTLVCRKALLERSVGTGGGVDAPEGADSRPPVPVVVMLVHLAFLVAVVLSAHHPAIFWAC